MIRTLVFLLVAGCASLPGSIDRIDMTALLGFEP